MQPITPLTLLVYVPTFLLTLALYGNPFRFLFEKYLVERNMTLDGVERVGLTLASGSALIPLIIMILTLFGGLLNTLVVRLLTLIFVMINLVIHRKDMGRLRNTKIIPHNAKTKIVLVVFLAIFIFHFYPSLGLFVQPGCDPALYSLITLRITESGGYTSSWGSFAPLAWYEERIHLTAAGFAGTCAFFNMLTGLTIEKTVFLLTLTYTTLISLGVYFLAKRLFDNRGIALCSAFVFGMLVQEPSILWFGWGGNAELSSLFPLPITIGLFWELFNDSHMGFIYLLYLAYLVAGMALLHPFSVFYLAFCLVPFSMIFIFKHRKLTPVLKSLIVTALSLIFILPIFIAALQAEMVIMKLFATYYPFWSPMIHWGQTPDQAIYSVIWRLSAVYGVGTFPLLIISLGKLRHHKIPKEPFILFAGWILAILFVHENNPNGLYVVPFPLWYRIDTNRVFTITSFSVAVIIGLGIYKTINGLTRRFPLDEEKIISTLKISLKGVWTKKSILLVLLLCVFQISLNAYYQYYYRADSAVTKADISAFNWIKQSTTLNATFFVAHNDAGYWIPVYTNRRAVIPFGVVSNLTLLHQYTDEIFPTFCLDPNSVEVLDFLDYHNVSYVYVGSKRILPNYFLTSLNSSLISKSPFFKTIYNQSDVYIFRYLEKISNTVWSDDDFLSGWAVISGIGGIVNGTVYKLCSISERHASATRDLQLSNVQNITYLVVRWRTAKNAKYTMQVTVDGKSESLINGQNSMNWTTSKINLNNFSVGNITSISIIVDGGCGYTDFVKFEQLTPFGSDD